MDTFDVEMSYSITSYEVICDISESPELTEELQRLLRVKIDEERELLIQKCYDDNYHSLINLGRECKCHIYHRPGCPVFCA
jgi:hypothetical protein